ncbi:RIKEN cDNA 2610019F03, isoform CRA_c, partial [Mus musculus]
ALTSKRGNCRIGRKSRLMLSPTAGPHWCVWLTTCGPGIQTQP